MSAPCATHVNIRVMFMQSCPCSRDMFRQLHTVSSCSAHVGSMEASAFKVS